MIEWTRSWLRGRSCQGTQGMRAAVDRYDLLTHVQSRVLGVRLVRRVEVDSASAAKTRGFEARLENWRRPMWRHRGGTSRGLGLRLIRKGGK